MPFKQISSPKKTNNMISNFKYITTLLIVLITVSLFSINDAQAQWQLGASFESRSEVPENGFGVQLEKHFTKIPLVRFRARTHLSYFSDEDSFSLESLQDGNVPDISLDRTVNSLDFGAGFIAELGLPGLPLSPYAGLGAGFEFFDVEFEDGGEQYGAESFNEDSFYYYGVIGLSITPIPVLTPFVEYRFTGFNYEEDPENAAQTIEEASGRLIFGLSVRF